MLYDIDQIRDYYRKFLEEKPSEYYERFDPDLLDKRPLVRDLLEKAFQKLFHKKAGRLLDVDAAPASTFPFYRSTPKPSWGSTCVSRCCERRRN